MPAVDDPFSIAASLPGQLADVKRQMKDLSVNNTQALTQALAAASASAASARAAATALQANAITPVTAVATSSATGVPFAVTATMVVPPGTSRCFYTVTSSIYVTSGGAFQLGFSVTAPSAGSTGYAAAGAAPFGGSSGSTAVGFLTGLTPGSSLSFTAYVGWVQSGSFASIETKVQALAMFQP